MKKGVIVLQHNGGQFANQLWLAISIYAYCLERGYGFDFPCFFEYADYFENIKTKNKIIFWLFFKPFPFFRKILSQRQARKLFRIFYSFYVELICFFKKERVLKDVNFNSEIYYLPPSKETKNLFLNFEQNNKNDTLYITGWLFRNPVGIEKYKEEIKNYFAPKKQFLERIEEEIKKLRKKYQYLVGVHIRQRAKGDGDDKLLPKHLRKERIYIYEEDKELVKNTLEEYLIKFERPKEKTCFLIVSNKNINFLDLSNINYYFFRGNLIEDLFILSKTEAIIGCNSTYSAFASYLGNIPLIIFQENIDWDYYRSNKFEKYKENLISRLEKENVKIESNYRIPFFCLSGFLKPPD